MQIVQLSDPHVRPEGVLYQGVVDSNAMFAAAIAHVNALDQAPDLILLTGDLVDEGSPEEYAMLRRLLAGLPVAETPDDLTVYREWPGIPLSALPHIGPAAAEAYKSLPDVQQCPAHARLDITIWRGVDE